MKYKATVTGIGPEAFAFLEPDLDLNFVIIFNENAPAELAELSVLHTVEELKEAPAVGDTVVLGKCSYTITAVGSEVEHTLRTLGHCTLAFSGAAEPYRPGCVMLKGTPLTEKDIQPGDSIEIY